MYNIPEEELKKEEQYEYLSSSVYSEEEGKPAENSNSEENSDKFKINVVLDNNTNIENLSMHYQEEIANTKLDAELTTNNEGANVTVTVDHNNVYEISENSQLSIDAQATYTGVNNNIESSLTAKYANTNGFTAEVSYEQNGKEFNHNEKFGYNKTFDNLTINANAEYSSEVDKLKSDLSLIYSNENITLKGVVNQDGSQITHSESFDFRENIKTKSGNVDLNGGLGYSSQDDALSSYLNIKSNIQNWTISGGYDQKGKDFNHTASVLYEKTDEDSSTKFCVAETNEQFTVDISHSDSYKNGVTTEVGAHYDKKTTYLRTELSKTYNPNKYTGENLDEVRREELVEAKEKFSFLSEFGYENRSENNNENSSSIETSCTKEGFYFSSSLLYRINDNNFLQGDYTNWENGRQVRAVADLKPLKIEYTNSKKIIPEYLTETNTLDVISKGEKCKYNLNITDTYTTDPLATAKSTTSFSGGFLFNRGEWGSFSEGFNAEINGSLILNDSNITGYSLKTDLGYNMYSVGNNDDTDLLVNGIFNLTKNRNEQEIEARISGALRLNNENTIIEPLVHFESQTSNGQTSEYLGAQLGIFQQVGKNHGDAIVRMQACAGQTWLQQENKKQLDYGIIFGGNLKVGKRTHISFESNWYNTSGFGGNIGARVLF